MGTMRNPNHKAGFLTARGLISSVCGALLLVACTGERPHILTNSMLAECDAPDGTSWAPIGESEARYMWDDLKVTEGTALELGQVTCSLTLTAEQRRHYFSQIGIRKPLLVSVQDKGKCLVIPPGDIPSDDGLFEVVCAS